MPIDPPETVYVTEKTVACDGGEGALGHPMVYLNMGEDGRIDCPYCDREFILEGGPADQRVA
ncbi:MAG: zinc-finger domain-containing protein [Sphingomonadales bacterium]|nr:zinc-finger domain-containing protein [Sphingomonadales bacterium]